jgi:hypothetical protein
MPKILLIIHKKCQKISKFYSGFAYNSGDTKIVIGTFLPILRVNYGNNKKMAECENGNMSWTNEKIG